MLSATHAPSHRVLEEYILQGGKVLNVFYVGNAIMSSGWW